MKRKGDFLAKATGTFLTMGFSTCLGFIVNLILARVLGPAGKGTIAPALSVATIGITIASLGLDHSAAYFLDKKPFRAKDVLLTSFLFAIISGVLASMGILLALEYVIPEATSLTRLFFAGGVFFTVIYNISHSGLLGRNRLGLINLGRVASDVLRTILATLFLYSLWPTIEGFAFAYMIAQALNAILVTVFAFREVGIIGAKIDLSFLSRAVGFGVAVFLASLTLQANRQIGVLILKMLRSVEETGLYAQAQTFANLLLLLPQALSFALYGAVVGERGKEEFTARIVRLSIFSLLVLSGIVALIAPWLIPALFTEKFTPSIPYLWGLLPGVVIYALPQLYASFIIASWGKPWYVFAASILGLSLNVLLNLLLIPYLGAWGTVIAFDAASIAMALYYVVFLKKQTGISIRGLLLPSGEDFRFLLRRLKSFFKR
ncbi:hypothetical protein CEE36_00155 [candidate division TA06 bacterium B3_TA06]|uniref:Uncharacterized protein n=1 Tax=candidate division TA06 bacterium B3_TA06 TaxID=2012487 RepID=A0A532VAJ6_UNCT6|nr:MAG: hypothetical protein CEE36_00155 [candidate division TA06 bacterium B3_TA06]